MKIVNQPVYDSFKANNEKDFYGKGILDYATRWANLMEKKFTGVIPATDSPLYPFAARDLMNAHARDLGNEADTEGITGFMYGCAVDFLFQTWEHGEALRLWSNADIAPDQPAGDGVLNPALLVVTVPQRDSDKDEDEDESSTKA